jgi:hypothetical protein
VETEALMGITAHGCYHGPLWVSAIPPVLLGLAWAATTVHSKLARRRNRRRRGGVK